MISQQGLHSNPRGCLPRAKLDPIHVPQIEDIYIDVIHEVALRRQDHSRLALAEIIQYGVAIVPKGFQTSEDEVDKVYNSTDGDIGPSRPLIEARLLRQLRRGSKNHAENRDLVPYEWIDLSWRRFYNFSFGYAPPRSKKQLKGKGAVGESSTSQEEAPESPLPSEPEQVITLEEEFMEDVPEGPSTQDVGVATIR
ncbi:hypothetical protein KI387_022085, partial [Taxus chinensis]